MDALLLALQNVSEQLLPILGAAALIFLCILLRRLCTLIEAVTATVNKLDPTLQKVDESIAKVQAPLDTVVKYSHSLDKVHDKTTEALTKAAAVANDSLDGLKEKFRGESAAEQEDDHVDE